MNIFRHTFFRLKIMRKLFFYTVLMSASVFGLAEEREKCGAAVSRSTFAELKERVDAGDLHAKYLLGKMYYDGEEIEANAKLGLKYLLEAARAGEICARGSLAFLYVSGNVKIPGMTEQEIFGIVNEALDREGENLFTLVLKGNCYYKGIGVPQDKRAAFWYFREALNYVGEPNELKKGQLQNLLLALSKVYIAVISKDKVVANLTRPEDLRRCEDIFKRLVGIKADDGVVSWGFGELLFLKIFSDKNNMQIKDRDDMFFYLNEATKSSEPLLKANAHLKLSYCYLDGVGATPNYERARENIRIAAELGNADAQYGFSELLRHGIGGKADKDESRKWLEKSAAQGNRDAIKRLGEL